MLGYSAIISLYLCVMQDVSRSLYETPVIQMQDQNEYPGGFQEESVMYTWVQGEAFLYLFHELLRQDARDVALQFEFPSQLWALQFGVDVSTALQFRQESQYFTLCNLFYEGSSLEDAVEQALEHMEVTDDHGGFVIIVPWDVECVGSEASHPPFSG